MRHYQDQLFKPLVVVSIALGLGILLFFLPRQIGAQETDSNTIFTYQGRLQKSGSYVTETSCNFQFELYDAPNDGNQLGETQIKTGVDMKDGYFTVTLDFGPVFTATKRYLEIAAQCPPDGDFTLLSSSRVTIQMNPYSQYALAAGTVSWNNINNMPSGFADGIDNVLDSAGGDLSGIYPNPTVAGLQGRPVNNSQPTLNQVLSWNGTQWNPAEAIPSGAVMFFALAGCPAGWSEYTDAQGRYLVGLPPGGSLEHTVGSALANNENRATGAHTHPVADPGHTHQINDPGHNHDIDLDDSFVGSGGIDDAGESSNGNTYTENSQTGIIIQPGSSNISIQPPNNTPPGTNAPYLQLLVCRKN